MNPILQVILALDASKFAAGTTQAQMSVNKLVAGIGSRLGAYLGVGSLAHEAMGIIRYADTVDDMAKKLGIGTDQFQEMQYAARKTGASIESFTSGLRALITAQQDALSKGGASEAFKPFATLGVSFADLQRLSPDQLLYRVGAAFKDSSQEGQQLDAVISLLGRGAMDLLGALREGLRELGKEAHALGQVMAEGMVHQLAAANNQIEQMKQGMTILEAPVVNWFYEALGQVYAGAGKLGKGVSGLFGIGGPIKSWNQSWADANAWADEIAKTVMGTGPARAPKKPRGRTGAGDMWSRIGDPGSVTSWKASSILGEEPKTPLTFGSADALARIGLFRGGYDPGERTRLQQLTELRNINNQLGRMLDIFKEE
jgi:hypothetical protein